MLLGFVVGILLLLVIAIRVNNIFRLLEKNLLGLRNDTAQLLFSLEQTQGDLAQLTARLAALAGDASGIPLEVDKAGAFKQWRHDVRRSHIQNEPIPPIPGHLCV